MTVEVRGSAGPRRLANRAARAELCDSVSVDAVVGSCADERERSSCVVSVAGMDGDVPAMRLESNNRGDSCVGVGSLESDREGVWIVCGSSFVSEDSD